MTGVRRGRPKRRGRTFVPTEAEPLTTVGVGVWDWDLAECIRLSPCLERLLRLEPGSFGSSLAAFLATVEPDDRERVSDAFGAMRCDALPMAVEFRVPTADGDSRWFGAHAEVLGADGSVGRRVVGALASLPHDKVVERRVLRQHSALLELVTHRQFAGLPLSGALDVVVRTAADVLEVARAGIWLYDDSGMALDCVTLFNRRTRSFERGPRVESGSHPVYFASVQESRATAITDVRRDPRTVELVADYFLPQGITSTLDVAVRRSGRKVGIVCHEHAGRPREWRLDEQSFAASIADIVSDLLESDARFRVEEALRSSQDRYRIFVEHSTEAIWRVDFAEPVRTDRPMADQVAQFVAHGRLVECNTALATLLGRESVADVEGQLLGPMVGHRNAKVLLEAWIRADYRLLNFDVEVGVRVGTTRWLSVSMTGVVEEGTVRRLWGICHDITDRRAELQTLEYETLHDGLTGLPNRAHLIRYLQEALDESQRTGSTFGVLLIDLDHFKEVNDTLGHYAGDHMLRAIGPRLRSGLDPGRQLMARLGGDEFAVVLKDFKSPDEPAEVASSLLAALREPFVVDGAPLEIGASIGGATYPADGTDSETLLRRADIAMYVAKRAHRGYAAYRAHEDPHTPRRLELLSELSAAIKAHQIVLNFQPKVDMTTGALAGLEVLSRWPHPRHGLVPPDEFIVLAEMGDVIRTLTSLIIDSTFAQWAEWASKGYEATFAINISARSLADDAIVEELRRALGRHRVPPGRIELEITERAFMLDPDQTLTRLRRLQALGVSLTIDEFGTGFSSLAFLRRMPLRALKIDRSFVAGMIDNAADRTVVNSAINLAHNLGLKAVAGGIETQEQFDLLRSLGCDFGQGWHVARPMAASDAWTAWERSR